MNPIKKALKIRRIKRITREIIAINKLNASEQYKADKAALAARLDDYDRF